MANDRYLGYVELVEGQNNAATSVNDALARISASENAVHVDTSTGAAVTITDTEYQSHQTFHFTGVHSAAFTVDFPNTLNSQDTERQFLFINDDATYVATIDSTTGGGTTVDVDPGEMALIQQIGIDFLAVSGGGGTFLELTDTPASYSGQGGKAVQVNGGGTALEFVTAAAGSGSVYGPGTWLGGVQVQLDTAYSVPNQSTTAIPWDSFVYDDSGDYGEMWEDTTNPSRITIPTGSGITKVQLCVVIRDTTSVANQCVLNVYKNGATFVGTATQETDTSGGDGLSCITPVIEVSETDYFEAMIFCDARDIDDTACTFSLQVIETTYSGDTGVGNGSYQFIEGADYSADATADLVFDPSSFDHFLVKGWLAPATDAGELNMLISDDDGATYETTANYKWINQWLDTGGTPANGQATGASLAQICEDVGNATDEYVAFEIEFPFMSDATLKQHWTGWATLYDAAGLLNHVKVSGSWDVADEVNGARFSFDTGNIADGRIEIYGIKALAPGASQIEDVASTTYSFVIGDANTKTKRSTSSSATTFTVEPDSTTDFPIGTFLHYEQGGTGALTTAQGAGVTINRRTGLTLVAAGQYSRISVQKTDANTWTLFGDT